MTRRRMRAGAAAFAALWIVVSCLDVSSPVDGIESITPVIAPTPSVVVGDTLRDTLGHVAKLRVYAFAPNGDTVRDFRVEFFVIDSTKKLRVVRIDTADGFAVGDSLSPNAQVVARVFPANGGGSLQTPPLSLPVVPVPQLVQKDSDITLFVFRPATDTLAATLLSPPISVLVRGGADTVIQKYLVSFELAEAPPSNDNAQPSAVLTGNDGRVSTVDTTDASGHAARRLRIRTSVMPVGVTTGQDTVTARVNVYVRYGQGQLSGSPVSITIRLTGTTQ